MQKAIKVLDAENAPLGFSIVNPILASIVLPLRAHLKAMWQLELSSPSV